MKHTYLRWSFFSLLFILGVKKINAQQSTPAVTTGTITNITATTAFGNGNVTNDGNDLNILSGLCYGTSANPTIANNTAISYYLGAGPFTDTIYSLNPNTTYYVKAFAINDVDTVYGIQVKFTTGSATIPHVTTDSTNQVTATTAYGYGNVTNDGNDPDIISGFCYSPSPNPTIADSTTGIASVGTGAFSSIIYSGLKPNTAYYVKAFAINAIDTVYGIQKTFTTGSITLPSITTDSTNNVTATTAFVYGNVTSDGNDPTAISGICYSTYAYPNILGNTTESYYYGSGRFTDTIYSLSPNTTYYVRAFVINYADTVYGNQISFTTGSAASATVTTDSTNNVTATTAFVYGNVTNNGNDPDVISGFYYSASANLTTSYDSTISYYYGTGPFADTVYGLSPNTKYYIRAYAINAAGTVYGSTISFTTGTATSPAVTTDSINTITGTTANIFGTVTNDGNDPDAISGFLYNSSTNPVVVDTIISNYIGSGSFFATLSHLNPLTTYSVIAFVTNAIGTSYGSEKTFTTGSVNSAAVTTDSTNGITATTAFLYGTVTNDGNDPGVQIGFCYNTSPNPTIANTNDTSNYNGNGVFTNTLNNLSPNTTYYIKAYATNDAGTVYGFTKQFTTGNATLPTVITDSVNNITDSTAFLYGNVINDGNDPTAISGFCIGTSPNPTIATADTIENNYNGSGEFYIVVYPLTTNTYYYVTAFSTNIAGTSYGKQIIFETGLNTGIEQINGLKTQLNLSPNPTNGLLNINFISNQNSDVEVNVLNALGANLNLSKTLTAITGNNTTTIDLSSVTSGIYFIQIKANGVVLATQKVIKTE